MTVGIDIVSTTLPPNLCHMLCSIIRSFEKSYKPFPKDLKFKILAEIPDEILEKCLVIVSKKVLVLLTTPKKVNEVFGSPTFRKFSNEVEKKYKKFDIKVIFIRGALKTTYTMPGIRISEDLLIEAMIIGTPAEDLKDSINISSEKINNIMFT